MTAFTYETDVPVRFRDIDIAGWVHNAIYLVYVEEARIGYFDDVLGMDIQESPGAIANQEIDYAVPLTLDDEVTVGYRVSKIGGSSLTMEFEVRSNGELAAEGTVTHILLDGEGTPRDVPEEYREKIRSFEEAPVGGE